MNLHVIRQRQIAWYYYEEDYSPEDLATMYNVKVTSVLKAINKYKSWYKEVMK